MVTRKQLPDGAMILGIGISGDEAGQVFAKTRKVITGGSQCVRLV